MKPIPQDGATTSRANAEDQSTLENLQAEAEGSPEIDNEDTCCYNATCFSPKIREIIITNPIFPRARSFTWASLFWFITSTTTIFMLWSILFFLLGNTMLPGGDSFGLFFLMVFSYILGWSLTYIPYLKLPPVFGMLVAGIVVRNTNVYNIYEQLGFETTAKIRTICLSFIMLRTGLQLTSSALLEHPIFVLILAIVPCTIEMLVVTICSKFILQYPWEWAFLTGTIIACMSPVVTANCMLALAARGYGEDKEMATLLCTATSIDDVHIVFVFYVCFSVVLNADKHKTEWWSQIPGGLRDLLLAIVTGIVLGTFFIFFPHRKHKYVLYYRLANLVFGSLMCSTAATRMVITGGGFLATVFMSFIATTGWRILAITFDVTPLRKAGDFMWHIMQPVLVGVIGADIDFHNWTVERFGLYLACILVGLLARSIFAFLSTIKTPFTMSERIFVALAWLPKGTLQAALAPMAFEHAKKEQDPDEIIALAEDIVRLSVVAIVTMAPLGAIIMMVTGPLLLNKISKEEHQRRRELSYLRIVSLQPAKKNKRRRREAEAV